MDYDSFAEDILSSSDDVSVDMSVGDKIELTGGGVNNGVVKDGGVEEDYTLYLYICIGLGAALFFGYVAYSKINNKDCKKDNEECSTCFLKGFCK